MAGYAAQMVAEAEARGDQAKARYWRGIQALIDGSPPLTPDQIARLRPCFANRAA